jgi:hypothetical protein
MLLNNIFLNTYSILQSEPVHKKRYAINLLLLAIAFSISAHFVTIISASKLLFVILTLAPIINFYFCVEKEICLDSGQYSLTLINLYAIIVVFGYFFTEDKIIYFIALNIYAIIKMLKTRELKISQISIVKNAAILTFTLFYAKFTEDFIYLFPVISIAFAVFLSMTKNYETFTNMNHYLCFNIMFFLPLFFSFDNNQDLMAPVTLLNFAYCLLVIGLGLLLVNLLIKFMLYFDLKYVLFTINEFSLIYLSLLAMNIVALVLAVVGSVVSFYFIDFDYRNSFIDPNNENIGNNEDLAVEMQVLKQKILNKEKPEDKDEPLIVN